MDFDKTAREILHLYRRQDMPIDVVEQNIAAALKAAYNEGLEAAAHDLESKFKVHYRGRQVALYGTAEAIRAKKVPA